MELEYRTITWKKLKNVRLENVYCKFDLAISKSFNWQIYLYIYRSESIAIDYYVIKNDDWLRGSQDLRCFKWGFNGEVGGKD